MTNEATVQRRLKEIFEFHADGRNAKPLTEFLRIKLHYLTKYTSFKQKDFIEMMANTFGIEINRCYLSLFLNRRKSTLNITDLPYNDFVRLHEMLDEKLSELERTGLNVIVEEIFPSRQLDHSS